MGQYRLGGGDLNVGLLNGGLIRKFVRFRRVEMLDRLARALLEKLLALFKLHPRAHALFRRRISLAQHFVELLLLSLRQAVLLDPLKRGDGFFVLAPVELLGPLLEEIRVRQVRREDDPPVPRFCRIKLLRQSDRRNRHRGG